MISGKLKGLRGQLGVINLTPAQISAMSIAGLNAILADVRNEITYIERELQNPNIEESTKVGMRENLAHYKSLVFAIESWLSLTSEQKARTNGSTFIRNKMTSYSANLNYYNPGLNMYNQNPGSFLDTLTADFGGLPVWAWAAILTGAIYMISQNK